MSRLTAAAWLRISIVLITLFFLSQITSVYLPVILSVILAFILNPAVNAMCRLRLWPTKCRIARGPSILLAYVIFAALILVLIAFIFGPFIVEFNQFLVNLPLISEQVKKLTVIIESRANSPDIPQSFQGILDQALNSATSYSVDLARRLVNGIISLATGIVELVVVPVLTFYLLKDWEMLREGFIELVPITLKAKTREVVTEMAAVVSGYIRGQVFVSIIVGLIVFAGIYIFRIDYPMVLGLLAGLTEMIPIVGPFIGAAPAVLLAYLVSPALALKVAIFYIVVQQIENHIIVPKVMGHSIDLHPIAIIISLLIGGQLFGIIGMMVAVPAAALIKVLTKHLWYYGER